VRYRFLLPTSLKQLKDIQEEWHKILLETFQNLHEYIPRRTAALLKTNVGPVPYYYMYSIYRVSIISSNHAPGAPKYSIQSEILNYIVFFIEKMIFDGRGNTIGLSNYGRN
jgi:hypothetical protein